MGNSAIGRGTAVEENKVKASSGATPDFLDGIVDGSTIQVVANQLVGSVASTSIMKWGRVTRTTSDADNSVGYTGVGFQADRLYCMSYIGLGLIGGFSLGFYETNGGIFETDVIDRGGDGAGWTETGNLSRLSHSAGVNSRINVVSLDADGYTLSFTKFGATGGVSQSFILAIKD
jgi:hypothetical protein